MHKMKIGGWAMKNFTTILGSLVLILVMALPVMAWHHTWDRGNHMMGYWGNGSAYGEGYGNLTTEQRNKLDAIEPKFNDETADLQNQIWTKSKQLDSILNSSNPDLEKAKAVQEEITRLRVKLDEETINYQIENRKIFRQDRTRDTYSGRYGSHMSPYGRGMGPGYCWN
jgi:zinc resistance-associated protein